MLRLSTVSSVKAMKLGVHVTENHVEFLFAVQGKNGVWRQISDSSTEALIPMVCPNCNEPATLINSNKGVWQCQNDDESCYSMRWVELPRNGVHILPDDLHIFFKARQKS
jgi:hypothetical protein